MRLTAIKSARQIFNEREVPSSTFIPISHFNAPHIFETKNGEQGCVIKLQGCSFEVIDASVLNWNQKILTNLLNGLSNEFAVYLTTYRYKHNVYPDGNFIAGFAADFDKAYREKFLKQQLYINELYLTLLIKGASGKVGKSLALFQKISHRFVKDGLEIFREKQREKLEKVIRQSLAILTPFMPSLLTEQETVTGKSSQLLTFFAILINAEKRNFLYPYQDISSYIIGKRLCFGHDTVQWIGNTEQQNKFAAIFSLKKYSPDTANTLLDGLLSIDCEYISTHSFLREEDQITLSILDKQIKHRIAVDDPAKSQISELHQARDFLSSGKIAFGYHHNTVMVLANSLEEIEDKVALVDKIYKNMDLMVIRESLNMENAFWAQIPGNFKFIRRGSLISTHNFSDFCSLHNYSHGYMNKNHLGSALMLVETTSKTPLYINFHERSSGYKHDISKGHTTIIAPSNAGKTTLINALDAQSKKYSGKSIFFDRDRGCEIYVRAMGGKYIHIYPGKPTGLNPLQLDDTDYNRDFLIKWLITLITTDNEILSADEIKQIETLVHRNFTLPTSMRTLSHLIDFVAIDFPRIELLRRWLRSTHSKKPAGQYAYLFDNPTNDIDFNHKMVGFDLTHLLDHEPNHVILSVMLYLFHCIELNIDGELTGIYLDEGWQLLENTFWKNKMRSYLPTLRKKNVYIVFATQSPGSVANSSLRDELIQGSATNIFLPNPKANIEHYIDAFKLSRKEYDFIKNTDPSTRYFLFKQGHESAIGKLNLSELDNFVAVFSANKNTTRLMDEIIAGVGDDPAIWLPIFHNRRKTL